jgi:ABC-type branched-subunit amino acid transport system substrate-binding protein
MLLPARRARFSKSNLKYRPAMFTFAKVWASAPPDAGHPRERRSRAVFLALVILLTFTACSGGGTFTVAVFIPADEESRELAEAIKQGIELARSEINSREGIHGKVINIRFYPCAPEKEEAERIFAKAIDNFSPILTLAVESLARILAPQAEKRSIPLIGLSIADKNFTEGKQWIFRNAVTHEEESRVILDTAAALNLRQVIIIHSGSAEDHEFIAQLQTKSDQENMPIRITPHVCTPEKGGYAAAIAAYLHAQAILFLDTQDSLLDGLAYCKSLGYRGKVLSRSALFNKSLRGRFPAVSVYSSAGSLYKRHVGLAKRVFDIFQVQYEKEMSADAALAYDTLIMLSKIIPSGRINRKAVRLALESEFVYPSPFWVRFSLAGEHDFVPRLYPVLISPDGTVEYLEGDLPDDALMLLSAPDKNQPSE